MSTSAHSSTADSAFWGHETHVRDFTRLADSGLLGHAYCFFGDEGVGKFRFARALAYFLEHGEWHADGTRVLSDALVVECGEEETSVGIDVVRTIRKFLAATPFRSSRRTVIIRDAELLTWEAESALLKLMEEPPVHALILVVVRTPEALFPPLASRMAKVHFSCLSRAELADILVRAWNVPVSHAKALAARSFGRAGYALRQLAAGKRTRVKKNAADETLAGTIDSLILAQWEKGVRKEATVLSFLLSRLEATSRFNLNPRLQEKAISYMISG